MNAALQKRKTRPGFTIVELLIVIVVVAILAAISIVAYTGIQNSANDSAVQSDLRNAGQKFVAHQVESPTGLWPNTLDRFQSVGVRVSKSSYGEHHLFPAHNFLYCYNSNGSGDMALVARSKSGNTFMYRNGSVTEYTGQVNPGDPQDICNDTGAGTNSRYWFFSQGSWRDWL